MPFAPSDANKHTKKATTDKLRRQWAAIANSVRDKCIKNGGDAGECDASAIQQANGAILKEWDEMTDIREAMTKKVAGKNHPAGDFLVVDDPEQVTTWHLPVKVNGKPDRALAGAAWAALFSAKGHRGQKYSGPDIAGAKRKLRALYKAEGWDEPASEADIQAQANLCEVNVSEFFGYDVEPKTYSSAVSFADLDAQREIQDSVHEIREDTADLWMMVDNVMWNSEIGDKVGALRSLFDEYLARISERLGSPPEVEEVGEVDLEEQSPVLAVTEASIDDLSEFDALLAEQWVELSDPRRAPVMVDFAIIRPGHGNRKDKRYYPAEMLERDGGAFAGVDIFVTNHDPNEKTERNKVGRFRSVRGMTEDGLVGTAILYDPDMAEKARNRADAGELGTLHCSILASGTGKKATMDGEEVTVIEAITQVHSVDLVSKAGAGGHAIALSEQDGGTMDPKENQEPVEELAETTPTEEQAEPVTIRESDEAPAAEEQPPQFLDADAVAAILNESDLDEKARQWVARSAYADEAAVQQAIAEMRVFVSELAPQAGQPFALGESAAPASQDVPKLLTPDELEERRRERTRRVLAEIDPTYSGNL